MEKIKNFLKKSWKIIAGIIIAIFSFILYQNTRKNKQEEKKKDIIEKNKATLKEVKEKEKEHENDINNSRNNYNDIISGRK